MVAPNLTHTPKQTQGQTERQQAIRRLQRGQSLAEVALSLTVLLLLVSGIVDLGRAFFSKIAMDNMISEGAHWATAYPACIPYAQNATNASQIPVNCRGTNSIIGRMINENKDLDRTRITDMSVTPQTAQEGDQLVIAITYQIPTITPIIRTLFGSSMPITVTATELVRGYTVPDFPGGPMTQPPNLSPVGTVSNITYVCNNGSAILSWGVIPASGYHVFLGKTQIATIPQPTDPSVVSITWTDPNNPARPGFGGGITYGVTAYNDDGAGHIVDSNQRLIVVSCSSIKPMNVTMSCTPLGAAFSWTMANPLDTAVAGYQILRYQSSTYKTMGTVSGATTWSGAINFDANPPDGSALYQIQSLNSGGTPIGPKSDPVGGLKPDGSPYCPPTTADLSISITGNPDPYVVVGSPLVYNVKITNIGPLAANNVVMTQTLDPSVVLDAPSLPSGCGAVGNQVTCNVANLLIGNMTIHITVIPQTIGSISTGVVVTADLPDPTLPNTAGLTTTVTDHPDLAISMIGTPATVALGNTINYSITVINKEIPVVNPTVTDTIPAGLTFVSCSPGCSVNAGQVTYNPLGVLMPHDTRTLQLVLAVPSNYIPTVPAGCSFSSGCIQNLVTVAPSDTVTPDDNTAFVTTPVVDLQMVSFTNAPTSVAAGSNIIYTMSVQNIGPDASNVSVSFTYPTATNMSLVTGAGATSLNCSGGGGMVTCNIGTMAAGTTSSPLTLVFAVPAGYIGPTTFPSVATVLPADPTGNNTASVMTTVLVPNLKITIPSWTTNVQAGSNGNLGNNITYNIKVENIGTVAAANVQVVETLPLGTTFDSSANPGWQLQSGSTYFYPLGTVDVGAVINVQPLVLGVSRAYSNSTTISNTLSVTPIDPDSSNNSARADTTVTAPQLWGVSATCFPGSGSKYKFKFDWTGGGGYPYIWNPQKITITSASPNVSWLVTPGSSVTWTLANPGVSIPAINSWYTFTLTVSDANGPIAASTTSISVFCSG